MLRLPVLVSVVIAATAGQVGGDSVKASSGGEDGIVMDKPKMTTEPVNIHIYPDSKDMNQDEAPKPFSIDDLRPNTHFVPISQVVPQDSPPLEKVLADSKGKSGYERPVSSVGNSDAAETGDTKKDIPEDEQDDTKADAKSDVKADEKAEVKVDEPKSDTSGTASLDHLLKTAQHGPQEASSLVQDGRPGIMRKESQFPRHNLADLAKTPEEKEIMGSQSPLAAAFAKRYGAAHYQSNQEKSKQTASSTSPEPQNEAPQNKMPPVAANPLGAANPLQFSQSAPPAQAFRPAFQAQEPALDGFRTQMKKADPVDASNLEEAKRMLSIGQGSQLTPKQLELIKREQSGGHNLKLDVPPPHQAHQSYQAPSPRPSMIRQSAGVPSPSPLDG